MNTEQLLLIAQEFCARYRTTVSNYAALAAAASASTARIEGIAVHGSARQSAQALHEVLIAFPALQAHNRQFAGLCAQVFLRLNENR